MASTTGGTTVKNFANCSVTVTGAPLTDAQACDPDYWATQLRLPVRFAPAVVQALADPAGIAIELGPRATLATLARQCVPKRAGVTAIASLCDAPEEIGRAHV